jgi:hypothetical protein
LSGAANIFRMILKPDAAKPLAALQWDIIYPSGLLRIEPAGILAGPAAEAAGKSITCAQRSSNGNTARLTCILAGGVQPIAAGVLAIVRFDTEPQAPKGVITVWLKQVLGVSPSVEALPIADATVKVTIR